MVKDDLLVIALADHLVVFTFAIALPAYARYNYPRFKKAIESGVPDARVRQYRRTLIRQWALTLLALAVWFREGRTLEAIGLAAPAGTGFIAGLAVALALAFLWRTQIRAALQHDEARERILVQLRALAPILPSSDRELRVFTALSLTAGICEEILFRGYFIWYLESYLGIGAAVVVSSVWFGLGHIYQGRTQALKIIVLGLVLALFYVGSGTLWIPIALHAALDAAQGRLACALVTKPWSSGAASPGSFETKPRSHED